jgi:hypothetical protein
MELERRGGARIFLENTKIVIEIEKQKKQQN